MEAFEITKYNASAEWMAIVFMVVLLLLGWVKNAYPNRFRRLFKSIINNQSLFQLVREELVFSHRGSIVLTLVFIVLTGLFLTIAGVIFNFKIGEQNEFVLIQFGYWCIITLLLYLFKWIINWLFLNLIQHPDYYKTYMFLVSSFNKIIGLVLLPITILAAYLPLEYAAVFIKAGFFLWAIILFYRLIKEVSISISFKIPRLYIILYLCAFEISPFLIGIKMVSILNI